jgi:hypothetical protein
VVSVCDEGGQVDKKKDRERSFLDELRAIYTEFPSGSVVDSECPDFLVQKGGKVIGIEMTDFVRGQGQSGSPQRESERLWDMVAVKAQAEFEKISDMPINIWFIGQLHKALVFSIVQKLASETVQLILRNIPARIYEHVVLTNREMRGTSLGQYISRIHILRVRNKDQVYWSSVRVDWTDVGCNEIANIIASKDAKIPHYLMRCDKVWLIIVAGAEAQHISSYMSAQEQLANCEFESHFDRVLIYDRIQKQVLPLKTVTSA